MNARTLRRAGALLLALALACSLLTIPAGAADDPAPLGDLEVALSPSQLDLKLGSSNASATLSATIKAGDEELADLDRVSLVWDYVDESDGVQGVVSLSGGNGLTQTVTAQKTVSAQEAAKVRVRLTVTDKTDPDNTAEDFCNVTVFPADPVQPSTPDISIKLSADSATLPLGESITITADVTPAGTKVNWTLSDNVNFIRAPGTDSYKATISTSSRATAATVGKQLTLTLTAEEDPAAYAICVIEVVAAPSPRPSSVQITTSPTTMGKNYVDIGSGNELTLTAAVSPAGVSEEDGRITWTSSNTSIAKVDPNTGVVTGVAPGEAVITADADGKTDQRQIEVSGILLSYVKKSASGGKGETIRLTEDSVVDIYQYRDITAVCEVFGNARSKTINWESSNNSVAQVLAGRVTAHYPGDNVIITATAAGTTCQASFKVKVSEDVAQAVTVDMGSEPSYSFSGIRDELDRRSREKAGGPLDCVYSLKVSTENGVLYYKYTSPETPGHGVAGTERYYYQPTGQGQMALKDVTFVPLPGFDGTAVVDYNAVSTNGTTFTGTIRIEATASGDVSYSAPMDQPIPFEAEHFSAVCKGRTGRAIGYVTFGLPSASRGTLYYNYSPGGQFSPRVSNSTRYYASSSPSIDNITFVPATGFRGDVEIPYRCADSSGASYSGTVRIRIYGSDGTTGSGDVEYTTGRNQRKSLNASDFNSACREALNSSLNYIRFTGLPSSSAGTLYQNYTSSSSTKVVTGRNYYRSSSPRISDISFVPASGYTGTVTIPFTGYDEDNVRFNANLVISVGKGSSRTISYSVPVNSFVRFNASDFDSACRGAIGDGLRYVRFDLPSSRYGTLYYQYNSATRTGTTVASTTGYSYFGSTPLLSDVVFAAASTAGTVSFGYTGTSTQGDTFTGTVSLTITGSTSSGSISSGLSSSAIRYTGSSARPISFQAADFQNACQAALGAQLSYVQFNTLPSSGRLYQNYSASSRTGAGVSSATHYGPQQLGQISYLPRAEFQGTLTVPYTAVSNQGASYSGTVELQVSNSYCSATFADTASGWDWAKPSIEFLRSSGITSGYGDNTYRPGQSISRGEFTLMICRAFQFSTGGSSGFPDVPEGSVYAGAVAAARNLGIVQGNNGRFQPDRPITRQSAMTMICRAIEAAGQSLPTADTALLSSYADGSQVSAFARPSVAALVQMGAVRGNSASRLNPSAAISRAEMAVILHRVLTR